MRTPLLISIATALCLPVAARAVTFYGNPDLTFRVDRPQDDYIDGEVTLDKVVVHHCGGGSTTYQVDEEVDPVAGHTVAIDPGDHCTATYHWDSNLTVDGPTYTVGHNQSTTTITFDEDGIDPVALTPCSVVSGTMSGGCPWLMAYVD